MSKVELTQPGASTETRNVKNLGTWSLRQARELPIGTHLTVYKGPGRGTIQYQLSDARNWTKLRETFGETTTLPA